jgi:hypothetical protein
VSNRKRHTHHGPAGWDDERSEIVDLLQEVMEEQDSDVWEDMIQLVEALSTVLRPVTVSPQFVRDLGEGLAAAAAPAEITIGRPSRRRTLWLGAVLSGSLVSATGVLVVWLRRRNRRSPVLAS